MNPQDPLTPPPTPPQTTPLGMAPTPTPQPPVTVLTPPLVPQPKKRRSVWIVIVATVVLLLVTGAVIYYLQSTRTASSKTTSSKTTTSTATTDTDSSTDLFGNMDQVSDGTATASTDCYSLTVPDGYTAGSPDNTTCTITLTNDSESTTTIKISAFSSAYCEQMDDVIDCINARYEEVAKSSSRAFYGSSQVSINAYRTGLAYIADSAGVKRAHYSIEQTSRASHASAMSSVTAFLITGPADTDDHDADTRLVAKSFIIK